MTGQRIQQEAICYQWFKQRLILSISEPSISQQRSQIKEDAVEPSVPAWEFNLQAYAAITWHNDSASLEPRLADHRSQAARTATLSTALPRQATWWCQRSNSWACNAECAYWLPALLVVSVLAALRLVRYEVSRTTCLGARQMTYVISRTVRSEC